MCTLSFVPYGLNGFILTNNRDESINRKKSEDYQQYTINNNRLFFSKDPQGNGSWLITNGMNRFICLLNGAFVQKNEHPIIGKSRGELLLHYFNYPDFESFLKSSEFKGYPSFTIVCFERFDNKLLVQENRWDGEKSYFKTCDETTNQLWASANLFENQEIERRTLMLSQTVINKPEELISIHGWQAKFEDNNNFLYKKGEKQTVSITQMIVNNERVQVSYYDLLDSKTQAIKIL